ncbi:LamG-like jellyroll fold domain-containing protein [Marivirga sp.]|uniref:LamG-like jellyroll fold domain-containing protein n=1 Tax=Marivirga sp. TaxID=2018662 RepID=UPI003DA789B8
MKRLIYILIIAPFFVMTACQDGYIDDISEVDPGSDQENPILELSSPSGNITIPFDENQSTIEVELEATDDIELGEVSISFDGEELVTFNEFIDYRRFTTTYAIENVEVGDHTLTVVATDLAGKSSEESVEFTLSNQYQALNGEILYMPFEGNSIINLIDNTEGTPNGDVTFASGVSGSSMRLNGAQESYVLFDPTENILNVESFTISYWVNPEFVDEDNDGGIDGVLGLIGLSNTGRFWGNVDLFVENGSNPTDGADMRLHFTNSSATETWITNVNDVQGFFDTWSYQVITYDHPSNTFKYYINGELRTEVVTTWGDTFNFADSGPMVLGCVQFQTDPSLTSATGSQPWASYLTGRIDEFKMFNRAISEAEVTAQFEENNPN